MLRRALILCFALMMPVAAVAEGWALASPDAEFRRVQDRETFVDIVRQGKLNRFGISLEVSPDGRISGRAFGVNVSGAWDWREGYFCRDLNWGATDLGPNCQEVQVSGRLVRFTSDEGKGRFADLRLD